MSRRLTIATSVVLLHLAALWTLQSGLLRRTVEIIVPAQILGEFIPPPQPQPETFRRPLPHPPTRAEVTPTPSIPTPQPALTPVPMTAPGPVVVVPTITEAVPPAAASPAAPPPAQLELPSSDATYLNNPRPSYPALSRRLGEQGKVVVRVLIGIDGTAQKAEIHTSSGYERLDQTALVTVLKWRYVPGKRGGVAEAMWFNVPISFVLE